MRLVLLIGMAVLTAPAAEYAVLESGFRMRIDRHEQVGGLLRLYTSPGSFIELAASSVQSFEAIEEVRVPAAAPPAAGSTPPPALVAAAAPPPPPNPKELVDQAAARHGLPPAFVHLVARAESGYRQDAVSHKGAIGIMQLMPGTAAALQADPHDPAQNVEAGTRYLRDLLVQYQDHPDQVRRALAAYNAGPGAVQRYNGVPPYRETQMYVHKIVESYRKTLRTRPAE